MALTCRDSLLLLQCQECLSSLVPNNKLLQFSCSYPLYVMLKRVAWWSGIAQTNVMEERSLQPPFCHGYPNNENSTACYHRAWVTLTLKAWSWGSVVLQKVKHQICNLVWGVTYLPQGKHGTLGQRSPEQVLWSCHALSFHLGRWHTFVWSWFPPVAA